MKIEEQLKKLNEIEKNYKREKESANSWRRTSGDWQDKCQALEEKFKDYDLEGFVNCKEKLVMFEDDFEAWRLNEGIMKKKITSQKREITRLKNKLGKSPWQELKEYILDVFKSWKNKYSSWKNKHSKK